MNNKSIDNNKDNVDDIQLLKTQWFNHPDLEKKLEKLQALMLDIEIHLTTLEKSLIHLHNNQHASTQFLQMLQSYFQQLQEQPRVFDDE